VAMTRATRALYMWGAFGIGYLRSSQAEEGDFQPVFGFLDSVRNQDPGGCLCTHSFALKTALDITTNVRRGWRQLGATFPARARFGRNDNGTGQAAAIGWGTERSCWKNMSSAKL